jgi:hypothetical protein
MNEEIINEDKAAHLSETNGWLENDDPFFQLMDRIVKDRLNHVPRILREKQTGRNIF